MTFVRNLIKKTLSSVGYEITKKRQSGLDPFVAQSEILRRLERNDLTIFDIGANQGQTAVKYRALFPDAKIFCFEPCPEVSKALERRFADDGRIRIIPVAVAQKKGVSTFYVNERDATSSLLPRPKSDRRYYPRNAGTKETIEVDTVSIDDFVSANDISRVDILKFDIQGGELNALLGAEKLLEKEVVSLIYTEIMFVPHYEGGALFHEISSFLSGFEYSLFDIYKLFRAKNGQLRYGDALFVSSNIRSNVIDRFPDEP